MIRQPFHNFYKKRQLNEGDNDMEFGRMSKDCGVLLLSEREGLQEPVIILKDLTQIMFKSELLRDNNPRIILIRLLTTSSVLLEI